MKYASFPWALRPEYSVKQYRFRVYTLLFYNKHPLCFNRKSRHTAAKKKTDEILQNRWENKMKSLKANKKYIIFLKYL